MDYKWKLKRGNFYKIKEGWFERGYTIVCPSENRNVGAISFLQHETLRCIFAIRGSGKKSELCTKTLSGINTSVRLVNEFHSPIRPLTRKDYIKVGRVLKKYGFIYNKKTNELVKVNDEVRKE